jgi:hypothetical protein
MYGAQHVGKTDLPSNFVKKLTDSRSGKFSNTSSLLATNPERLRSRLVELDEALTKEY